MEDTRFVCLAGRDERPGGPATTVSGRHGRTGMERVEIKRRSAEVRVKNRSRRDITINH